MAFLNAAGSILHPVENSDDELERGQCHEHVHAYNGKVSARRFSCKRNGLVAS